MKLKLKKKLIRAAALSPRPNRMSTEEITLEEFIKMLEYQDQSWEDLAEMLYHRMPKDDLIEMAEEWKPPEPDGDGSDDE